EPEEGIKPVDVEAAEEDVAEEEGAGGDDHQRPGGTRGDGHRQVAAVGVELERSKVAFGGGEGEGGGDADQFARLAVWRRDGGDRLEQWQVDVERLVFARRGDRDP